MFPTLQVAERWHDPIFGHTFGVFLLDVFAIAIVVLLVAFALRKFGIL